MQDRASMALGLRKPARLLITLLLASSCDDWSRAVEIWGRSGRGNGQRSDASVPTGDGGQACWAARYPEVQPRPPERPATESCSIPSQAVAWATPTMDTTRSVDARDRLVGRWVACGEGGLVSGAHAGIELGANGRWRLLERDAAGALVPVPATEGTTGRYYFLSRGQLEVLGEGFGHRDTFFVSFGADMDLARFVGTGSGTASEILYARTDPSPLNGRDNVPSISDGQCSMVGTWDLAATASSPSASFSFDAAGNFVGGPVGSDLCAAHTMYGTYRLSPGLFQFTSNVGMGQCDWWFDAGYPATFSSGCDQLSLVQHYDNCTGGRGYFNGPTTLTRRR